MFSGDSAARREVRTSRRSLPFARSAGMTADRTGLRHLSGTARATTRGTSHPLRIRGPRGRNGQRHHHPVRENTVSIWFVTGASRGLGLEIVRAALARGDSVVAAARTPEAV